MTAKDHRSEFAADHGAGPHARRHHHAVAGHGRARWGRVRRGLVRFLRRRWVRRTVIAGSLSVVAFAVALLALWWRLANGPIGFDMATPWLTAAIQENFGPNYAVKVGGAQLERDEDGRTSLRILGIEVRDPDGAVVASAPKAEVGLSGAGLLTGQVRAASLNLVGAELSVRIETDGRITIFAGGDSKPIASAPLNAPPPLAPPLSSGAPQPADAGSALTQLQNGMRAVAGMLAWIDGLGATGLDGHDLRELGLKNGNLTVDDQRNGKRWTFSGINVGLSRPHQGGIIFRIASDSPERPWELSAALRPLEGGIRAVGVEARRVSARDLLLAMRINEIEAEFPISASMRAEFSADGQLQAARGQVLAEAGYVKDPDNEGSEIKLDHADIRLGWDARQQSLVVPFQVQAGGTQLTMLAQVDAVPDRAGVWNLSIARGDPVVDPIILSGSGQPGSETFAFNRVAIAARVDTQRQRIEVSQGDFGRQDVRSSHNVGVAVTGSLDFAGPDPRLTFGVAGTRMPVGVMKRLWPLPVASKVRSWVDGHISGGTVERILIAGNVPVPVLMEHGTPIPDEGLSVEIETSGTTLKPVDKLPEIRDADLNVRVTGRTAYVGLGRGTVEVGGGRRLAIAGGRFEVPDTHPKGAPAKAVFRVDGTVPAGAALLASEGLRHTTGIVLDPATSRGTLSAQVALDLALTREVTSASYSIAIDFTNFAAERLLMGQKVEAAALRVNANSSGYAVKGDVKINGTPASLEFRKAGADANADLRLQATLDEAARRRIGIDLGSTVTGAIPVKVTGQIPPDETNVRLGVEADFTAARIDNLLPGWSKLPGKAAKATFTLVREGKNTRFDDLTIEGQGALAKGSVEIDGDGDLVAANFPVFGLSDGDKVAIKAERTPDNVLRVVMRGEVYDGRAFVKTSMANMPPDKTKHKTLDMDLDIKIGAVAGFNGELLRGLELRLNRRAGRIRSFVLNGKIGRDTPLLGDLRLRARDNHQVVYLETDDAGALFRFTDTYPRMFGGQMWLAMDPPTTDNTASIGVLNIRNFIVRGEPGLERVVAGAADANRGAVEFSELRCDFARQPGRMVISEGIVRGPLVGATIDGQIDYAANDIRVHGTFVPLYAINNMFGQIPIVGIFLGGGSKEGLLGINYEASGPPSAPRIIVNPISAVAPGLLRKLLPTPGMFDPKYLQPTR